MASRATVSTGRVGRPAKVKGEKEDNQKSLDFKGDIHDNKKLEKKRVSFEKTSSESDRYEEVKNRESEETKKEINELKEYILKEICDIKKERKSYLEVTEEWKKKERNWEIRIRIVEEKLEEKDREIKDLKEKNEVKDVEIRELKEKIEEIGKETSFEDIESLKRERSRERSRAASSRGSYIGSDFSDDRLSVREVGKVRKWLIDKERIERRNNITLKGIDIYTVRKQMREEGKEEEWMNWVEKFIKVKLGVEGKVIDCTIRGRVIIATLENEIIKREVMVNKSKLKGEQIYIDNDLTWEERKIQERIGKWAKEQREKGEEIKVGRGKVKIKDKWIFWEEIEKGMEKAEEGRGERSNDDKQRREKERGE